MEKEQQFANKQENAKSFKERWRAFSRNHPHIKIGLSIVVCLCIMLFIVFGIPSLLHLYLEHNNFSSKASADAWISSLGSYWGGVLGGLATLIALRITINTNQAEIQEQKEELKQKEMQEKEEERIAKSKKCSLIVYYDFCFAFDDIITFCSHVYAASYEKMIKKLMNKPEIEPDDEEENEEPDDVYYCHRQAIRQLYIDENWIRNVAELASCNVLSDDEIRLIYKIYGNLQTIRRWVDADRADSTSLSKAILSIKEIVNLDNVLKEDKLLDDIESIYKRVKDIAGITDDEEWSIDNYD